MDSVDAFLTLRLPLARARSLGVRNFGDATHISLSHRRFLAALQRLRLNPHSALQHRQRDALAVKTVAILDFCTTNRPRRASYYE